MSIIKKALISAAVGALFLIYTTQVRAAAMEFTLDGIDNNLTQINYDQSIDLLFSFNNVVPTKSYYLAGVFQQAAGSNYFGFTQNNNNWYKYGDDYTNFYKLDIKDSSLSGKLTLKPDIDSSGFKGTGDYLVKIFRYCTSSSSCGETKTLTIKIIAPPSPSPLPSVSPSPDPSPSPNPSLSPSPTPLPLPSKSPSPKPSPTPSEEDQIDEINFATEAAEVLGATESATTAGKIKNPYLLSFGLIGSGIILLVTFTILFYNQKHEAKI